MYDKLTKSDIQKMNEEIEYRKLELRKQLLEEVKETRAHGDLSENFEYHAAKREKNRNESRIRYLERMIKTAHIIDDSSKDNEVGINNRVEVQVNPGCSYYVVVKNIDKTTDDQEDKIRGY